MAYVINDLNDFEMEYDDGFRTIVIWKQNVRFGSIVGDVLTLYWHNKAQTDTRYQLELDWNDCTSPVVVSAADLQTKIEDIIRSGWSGGAGDGGNVISAGGVTAASTGTVVFSNANSVSFGMVGQTVTASISVPAATSLVYSNSNGVTFGIAGSTLTASHNGITSQSVQTQNMVSVLGSTGDISFANSNGITFGGNNSTITASHNGITAQSVQPVAVSGSNGSFQFSTLTVGNLNGMSFYTSNGSLVGSHNGLTTQTNQVINFTATGNTYSNTTGSGVNFVISGAGDQFVGLSGNTLLFSHDRETHKITAANGSFSYSNEWGAFNSNGISFSTTVSGASSGLIGSHNGLTSQSNQALSGSNGSFTFQTATFGNLNGVSFYSSNGSLVASHNGLTSQSVQPVAISGSNGSFSFSTVTFGNLNGASFYTSNGSVVMSYTVPAAGGALSFSAGTTSNTLNSLVFSNSNGVSFGLNGSTVTASVNAAAGGDITLSMWPDRIPGFGVQATQNSGTIGTTGGSTQLTATYHVASIQIPHPIHVSNLFGFNAISATSAGTGSATVGQALGLYSVNANTALSLISTWNWRMFVSQNSVTARTHHWFWGTASSTNSSSLAGNVSASFTNAGNAARRFLFGTADTTLDAGQYYIVSAYFARSTGANVYNIGSQVLFDGGAIFTIQSMVGESNYSRLAGFNGVFSTTTNMSNIAAPIMPSSVNTSAITVSSANLSLYRNPYIIFERSKS